ncbi:NADPH:quinone reductase [Modestobacter sp. Leaf380]|uniref:NADPH:quinone reductase n=1 Tax=Modestobacter sp. Leaf380 TaxID=1736356 RepID=UPI0006F78D51|nr:NADPH:quinone reductase [Modestobacter sp. Leaf380]KQS66120.1 NADPH:quinone reductase [Modestobacter sp. Leaf380]
MRAITHTQPGGPDVLQLTELPTPEPGPGEVRVRLAFSGVNPTDWKSRSTTDPGDAGKTPDQDGSGTIDAVGEGVDAARVGERVWVWEAAWQRSTGTAAEHTVVPTHQAVPLGEHPFELGAALGIPFMTAHRCLTVAEELPDRIGPGTLEGRVVLVQGGAGAVGNAAIQLAHWAGATVIATISSPRKAQLAAAAGADHVIDYTTQDVVAEIGRISPRGVDAVVEVSIVANAASDVQVLAPHASVAVYADDGGTEFTLPVRALMAPNARFQFVLVYTAPARAKGHAVDDITAALAAGAIRVGEDAGLPLHTYPLAETGAAHQAVQDAVVGKVLVDVTA